MIKDYLLWIYFINPIAYGFKIVLYACVHGCSDDDGNGQDVLDRYSVTYPTLKPAWLFLLCLNIALPIIGYFTARGKLQIV